MRKKVLITGGNGDIAKSIARKLGEEQYDIRLPGKNVLDVTDISSAEAYIAAFVPDILINNAGFVVPQSIRDCDLEKVGKSLNINLFGTFNCTAAVLRRNPQAQIINIGSSAATKLHGTWRDYCAAKAAVVMATQCWAEDEVNTVCISPGRTETKMRRGLYPDEDRSTLLNPDDFAQIVIQAIQGQYESGTHLNVNLQNVGELIHETERDNHSHGETIYQLERNRR